MQALCPAVQVDEWRQPIGRKPVSSFFFFFTTFFEITRRVFSGTKKVPTLSLYIIIPVSRRSKNNVSDRYYVSYYIVLCIYAFSSTDAREKKIKTNRNHYVYTFSLWGVYVDVLHSFFFSQRILFKTLLYLRLVCHCGYYTEKQNNTYIHSFVIIVIFITNLYNKFV